MNIPDYISPIVGYRVWRWNAAGLKSLNSESWLAGKPVVADCRIAMSGTAARHAKEVHKLPQLDCTCGIYASKSLHHLRRTGYMQYGIVGEVHLWGLVVEHTFGWRAQFAYPKTLLLPFEMLPFGMQRLDCWLKKLTEYGCDIFVRQKHDNVPLWCKNSGFEVTGLNLIMRRSKGWYAQRAQERQVKRGDRVAALDHGIAVVEQVDADHINVKLGDRSVRRIRRMDIYWDEGNMRWETKERISNQRQSCL
jgi:hypothetical protein